MFGRRELNEYQNLIVSYITRCKSVSLLQKSEDLAVLAFLIFDQRGMTCIPKGSGEVYIVYEGSNLVLEYNECTNNNEGNEADEQSVFNGNCTAVVVTGSYNCSVCASVQR